ncbi:MAG: hypothetical protein OEZ11_10375 [Gammaproteobacteria bacterium]|nr:hypothetical protein [Gammaproteobacteria bacterium]
MNPARLSLLCISVLIAACGSGSDRLGNRPSTTTFAITPANAATATRVAWEAALASADFGNVGSGMVISTSSPGDFSKPGLATSLAGKLINPVQMDPLGPVVRSCFVRGIVTTTGDVADVTLATLSTGDTFRDVYEFCDDGFGEVIDGTVDVAVREFTGDLDTGLYMLSLDVVLTDLQVATGTDTVVSNGDTTVTLDSMQSPFLRAGASGTSMTVDSNASSETLSDFTTSQTIDAGVQTLPFTLAAAGTLDSTQLAGVVRYSTPVTFAGEGFDFPSSGTFLVMGENSSARLTAVDNINVMIEIDGNGDGVVDATINTTWAALAAS